MYFSRIFVLLMVLPQLALGQVAVTPRASSSDVEAQLLNRAARAELRGYAIQQEMQTQGEAFAKDPAYQWDANSLSLARMSASERSVHDANLGRAIGTTITGGTLVIAAAFWIVALSNGRYSRIGRQGKVVLTLGGFTALIGTLWLLNTSPSTTRADYSLIAEVESFRQFVESHAQEDDLASARVDLIDGLFRLSSVEERKARDTLIGELKRGNYDLNATILRKTGVLTEAQIAVFEKFQKDTSASLTREPLIADVSAKNVAIDALSHLELLRNEIDARKLKLESLKDLPRKAPGGMTAAELHQRHLDWAKEVDGLITQVNDGLAAISNQR
jgi:hypothetical protein